MELGMFEELVQEHGVAPPRPSPVLAQSALLPPAHHGEVEKHERKGVISNKFQINPIPNGKGAFRMLAISELLHAIIGSM
jgi:hypothetical protein